MTEIKNLNERAKNFLDRRTTVTLSNRDLAILSKLTEIGGDKVLQNPEEEIGKMLDLPPEAVTPDRVTKTLSDILAVVEELSYSVVEMEQRVEREFNAYELEEIDRRADRPPTGTLH